MAWVGEAVAVTTGGPAADADADRRGYALNTHHKEKR